MSRFSGPSHRIVPFIDQVALCQGTLKGAVQEAVGKWTERHGRQRRWMLRSGRGPLSAAQEVVPLTRDSTEALTVRENYNHA